MANTLLTPTIIAREALFQLRNNLVMGNCVHRDYKKEFVKIGDSVTIRKPVKFTVTDGATRSNQDVTENQTSITINKRKHVSWNFSTQDLTLTIEEYSKRYIEPAAIALANQVDLDLLREGADEFWLSGGTPGTTPNTFASLGQMARKLDDVPSPDDGKRKLILNPDARWTMADALKGIYDNSMPRDYVRKGLLGVLANFQIYGDQNVHRHTTGRFTTSATPVVNGASQTGNTLVTQGWDAGNSTVKKGDVFTVAGVNSVNDVSKADNGTLQQFVVTADTTSAAGAMTIPIAPSITTSGAYQTVTGSPADSAALTFNGSELTSYPQNLAMHQNALALVMCPLELPDSAAWKARVNFDGISIRLVKSYDVDTDVEIIRMDILYGTKAIYPEIGGRLWG